MKITVKIDNQLFEVEIESLYTRPIVAIVDGTRFQVWPEVTQTVVPAPASPAAPAPAPTASSARTGDDANIIYAPIPGVIISLAVEAGSDVSVGQELCVLEAMKMKNVIRSPRAGTISAIKVSAGQHVKHHEPLIEFAEANHGL
jgi:biotin carboxyl carrier protein